MPMAAGCWEVEWPFLLAGMVLGEVTAAASFFRKMLFDWSEEGQDMLICTIKNNFRICQQVKGSSSLPLLCSWLQDSTAHSSALPRPWLTHICRLW